MSTIKPQSYIITQVSDALSGANAVVPNSSNQTSDVYSSVGIASTSNHGNMNLIGLGIPDEKNTIDIRIQNSGTITREATFIWKDEDGNYEGTDDFRYMSSFRAPFSRNSVNNTTAIPQACHGATAIYADFLGKEFLYYVKAVSAKNVVHVAHRNVDGIDSTGVVEETASFTLEDITLPIRFQSSTGDLAQIDVCKTVKNTLLMVCSADQDLQMFESTNGTTWTLVASDIIKRFVDEDIVLTNLTSLKIASSGNYVRVVFASKSSSNNNFVVLGSSDGGLSFKQLNVDSPIDSEISKVDSYSNYSYAMDLCAVRDSDGSFMMVVGHDNPSTSLLNLNPYQTRTYLGVANSDFIELDENRIDHDRVFVDKTQYDAFGYIVKFGKLFLCKTDSHIYLFDTGRVPYNYPLEKYLGSLTSPSVPPVEMKFSYEIRVWRMPLDGLVSSNRWYSLNGVGKAHPDGEYRFLEDIQLGITGFCNGAGRYWFGRSKFYFIGNCIACFGTMVDTENAGIDVARHQYFRMNTFSRMPISDSFPKGYSISAVPDYAGKHQPSGKLFDLQWNCIYGLPQGNQQGISDSPWEFQEQSGLHQLFPDISKLYVNNDSTGYVRYELDVLKYLYKNDYNFFGGGTLLVGGMCFEAIFGKIDSDFDYASATLTDARPVRFRFRDYVVLGNTLYDLDFRIEFDQEGVYVYDANTFTRTKIQSHSGLNSGNEPFANFIWEMRIVLEATSLNSPIGQSCRVLLRRRDRDEYHESSSFSLLVDTGTASGSEPQTKIGIQMWGSSGDASPRVEILSWNFHTNSSLGHLDENGDAIMNDYTQFRGRSCNTLGYIRLQNNMRLAFGGGSSAEGDTYQLTTQDVYDINNITGSSLLNWQSSSDTTDSEIIFESNKNAFAHNGWGLFGLNCKTVTVEYSNTADFSSGVNTIFSTNLSTGIVARVDTVYEGNQTVEVSIDSLEGFQDMDGNGLVSTDKYNVYARFTALSASNTNINLDESFKIIDHFDNKFVLDGDTSILASAVSSTLTVYSDRVVVTETNTDDTIKKYMRVTLSGDTFEGYHTLGSVVAGQVIDFNVPMDWSYTDQESANLQNNFSRSGVKWAYPEGPPTRTISGRIIGDVSQYQRSKMRTALRKQQYSANPLVLVLEDSDKQNRHPNNVILSRYTNELAFDNAGWYYHEATETWYPVGDLSVTFEEDV